MLLLWFYKLYMHGPGGFQGLISPSSWGCLVKERDCSCNGTDQIQLILVSMNTYESPN